ncbi:MAG TPA: hypothetical protein VHU87_10925 [Rhizomicrobium sp.]|nr:hypothetical protein [Rhizomicrobium sp.]
MNRDFWLKASTVGTAVGVAIVGGSLGTADWPPAGFGHSPFSAADTMQAGIFHAGAQLGHLALQLFYVAR